MQLNDRVKSGNGLVVGVASEGDIERFRVDLGDDHYAYFDDLRRVPGRREPDHLILKAEMDGRIVGVGLVRWGRAHEVRVRRRLWGVPQLYHFQVREDYRRRGIGTALLRAAEDILRQRGYTRVLLGVDLSNKDAFRLYERRGYVPDERLRNLRGPQRAGFAWLTDPEPYDILVHDLVPAREPAGRGERSWLHVPEPARAALLSRLPTAESLQATHSRIGLLLSIIALVALLTYVGGR